MVSEVIPSELISNTYASTAIFPFIFISIVVFLIVFSIINLNKKMKAASIKIDKMIENGEGLDELKENLKLNEEKSSINSDFFNSSQLYGKLRYYSENRLDYNLYPDENSINPITISEPLYILGRNISFRRPLDRFKGVVLTKTKNNFILGGFKNGIFSVKLDNVFIGKIDVLNKKIFDEKNKKIGELILPKNGTFKVSMNGKPLMKNNSFWEIKFNEGKSAEIYTQHGTMKNILSQMGKYKLIINQKGNLTKKEKSIVLVFSNYLRIKGYMFQMLTKK
jgi:hypothetical protein